MADDKKKLFLKNLERLIRTSDVIEETPRLSTEETRNEINVFSPDLKKTTPFDFEAINQENRRQNVLNLLKSPQDNGNGTLQGDTDKTNVLLLQKKPFKPTDTISVSESTKQPTTLKKQAEKFKEAIRPKDKLDDLFEGKKISTPEDEAALRKFRTVKLPDGEHELPDYTKEVRLTNQVTGEYDPEASKLFNEQRLKDKPQNFKELKEFQKDIDKIEYLDKKFSTEGAEVTQEDERDIQNLINKRNTLVGIHNNLTFGELEDYKLFNAYKRIKEIKAIKDEKYKDIANTDVLVHRGVMEAINIITGSDDNYIDVKSKIRKEPTNQKIQNQYLIETAPKTIIGETVKGLTTTATLSPLFALSFSMGGVAKAETFIPRMIAAIKGSVPTFLPGGVNRGVQKTIAEINELESKGEQLNVLDKIWIGVKNIGGESFKAIMEPLSEIMLPGVSPGKTMLGNILKKATLGVAYETGTEQITDITGDLVDGTKTSILVSLIKDGKIGKEALNQFIVESLIALVYGGSVGYTDFWRGHLQQTTDPETYTNINKWIKDNQKQLEKNFSEILDQVTVDQNTAAGIAANELNPRQEQQLTTTQTSRKDLSKGLYNVDESTLQGTMSLEELLGKEVTPQPQEGLTFEGDIFGKQGISPEEAISNIKPFTPARQEGLTQEDNLQTLFDKQMKRFEETENRRQKKIDAKNDADAYSQLSARYYQAQRKKQIINEQEFAEISQNIPTPEVKAKAEALFTKVQEQNKRFVENNAFTLENLSKRIFKTKDINSLTDDQQKQLLFEFNEMKKQGIKEFGQIEEQNLNDLRDQIRTRKEEENAIRQQKKLNLLQSITPSFRPTTARTEQPFTAGRIEKNLPTTFTSETDSRIVDRAYSGGDIPFVQSNVIPLLNNNKVFDAIIRLVPIDMMNDLIGEDVSPKELLHNKSMFFDALTSDKNGEIGIRARASIVRALASFGAKLGGSPAGSNIELNSTLHTKELSPTDRDLFLSLYNSFSHNQKYKNELLKASESKEGVEDAIQKQKTTTLDVQEQTENGKGVGGRNKLQELTGGEGQILEGGEAENQGETPPEVTEAQEEIVTTEAQIEPEEDLESEQEAMSRVNPTLYKLARKSATVEDFIKAVAKANNKSVKDISTENLTNWYSRVEQPLPKAGEEKIDVFNNYREQLNLQQSRGEINSRKKNSLLYKKRIELGLTKTELPQEIKITFKQETKPQHFEKPGETFTHDQIPEIIEKLQQPIYDVQNWVNEGGNPEIYYYGYDKQRALKELEDSDRVEGFENREQDVNLFEREVEVDKDKLRELEKLYDELDDIDFETRFPDKKSIADFINYRIGNKANVVDSRTIRPINETTDEILSEVQNAFDGKYSDVPIKFDKEGDPIEWKRVRIADHSGNYHSIGGDGTRPDLSIVITNKDATKDFRRSDKGMPNEYYFDEDSTPQEIIDFINEKLDIQRELSPPPESKRVEITEIAKPFSKGERLTDIKDKTKKIWFEGIGEWKGEPRIVVEEVFKQGGKEYSDKAYYKPEYFKENVISASDKLYKEYLGEQKTSLKIGGETFEEFKVRKSKSEPPKVEKQPWEMTIEEFQKKTKEYEEDLLANRELTNPKFVETYKKYKNINSLKAIPNLDATVELRKKYPDADLHRGVIQNALAEGKTVPPQVLKDYPDLKPAESKDNNKEESFRLFNNGKTTGEVATALNISLAEAKEYSDEFVQDRTKNELKNYKPQRTPQTLEEAVLDFLVSEQGSIKPTPAMPKSSLLAMGIPVTRISETKGMNPEQIFSNLAPILWDAKYGSHEKGEAPSQTEMFENLLSKYDSHESRKEGLKKLRGEIPEIEPNEAEQNLLDIITIEYVDTDGNLRLAEVIKDIIDITERSGADTKTILEFINSQEKIEYPEENTFDVFGDTEEAIKEGEITNEQAKQFTESDRSPEEIEPTVKTIERKATDAKEANELGEGIKQVDNLLSKDIDEIFELTEPKSKKKSKAKQLEIEGLGAPKFRGAEDYLKPKGKGEETSPLFQQPEEVKGQEKLFEKPKEEIKSENRVVKEEKYQDAKKRLGNPKKINFNLNANPLEGAKVLKDLSIVGAYHFENGLRKFSDWSEKMIEEYGDKIKEHLKDIWKTIDKKFPKIRLEKELADTKVRDEKGNILTVYSGHANTSLYKEYNPKKSTAGGYYASESPEIASNYSMGKFDGKEYYENGEQYRIKGKNGEYNKKLWQIELTEAQKKKLDELSELKDEYDEYVYRLDEMMSWAKDNKNYEPLARRILARGKYDLQNIYDYNEQMGYNIAYPKTDKAGESTPLFTRQEKNDTELIMDGLGIDWQSYDWNQPGVFPVYLNIRNPLDADKPFPQDLLTALKDASKYEREKSDQFGMLSSQWTNEYPLKQWVKDIESGDEGWSTQIPKKALPILKQFGYDGIKERGSKGIDKPREERGINWIAFDKEQIISKYSRFAKTEAEYEQAKNRLISEESFTQAKQNIITKGQQLTAGIDPSILKDYATVGAYHLENLFKSVGEKADLYVPWYKQMIKQFGEKIRRNLRKIWHEAKRILSEAKNKIIEIGKTPAKETTFGMGLGQIFSKATPKVEGLDAKGKQEYLNKDVQDFTKSESFAALKEMVKNNKQSAYVLGKVEKLATQGILPPTYEAIRNERFAPIYEIAKQRFDALPKEEVNNIIRVTLNKFKDFRKKDNRTDVDDLLRKLEEYFSMQYARSETTKQYADFLKMTFDEFAEIKKLNPNQKKLLKQFTDAYDRSLELVKQGEKELLDKRKTISDYLTVDEFNELFPEFEQNYVEVDKDFINETFNNPKYRTKIIESLVETKYENFGNEPVDKEKIKGAESEYNKTDEHIKKLQKKLLDERDLFPTKENEELKNKIKELLGYKAELGDIIERETNKSKKKYLYVSLTRPLTNDSHIVSLKGKHGDEIFTYFDSEFEAIKFKNQKIKEGYTLTQNIFQLKDKVSDLEFWDKVNEGDLLHFLDSAEVKMPKEIEEKLLNRIKARSWNKHLIHRRFVPGLKWTPKEFEQNLINTLHEASNKKNKLNGLIEIEEEFEKYRNEVQEELKAATHTQKNILRNDLEYAQKFIAGLRTPDNRAMSEFRQVVSLFDLGFLSIPFITQQATQNFQMALPNLINELGKGKTKEANKIFVSSMRDTTKVILDSVLRLRGRNSNLAGQELTDVLYRLKDMGQVAPIGSKVLFGEDPDPRVHYNNTFSRVADYSRNVFSSIGQGIEYITRLHTAIMFFKAGKIKGLKDNELAQYVAQRIRESMGDYSKVGRIVLMNPKVENQTSLLSSAFRQGYLTYKTYSAHNTGLWYKLLNSNVKKGLGTKAFVGFATHGIKKYPLFGTLLGILAPLFGLFFDDDMDEEIAKGEEWLDNKTGPLKIGSLINRGTGTYLNMDLSNLFQESAPLPTESFEFIKDKLSLQTLPVFTAELLIGRPYTFLEQIGREQYVPRGLKLFFPDKDYKEEGLKFKNKTIIKPEDIQDRDVSIKRLGFQPETFSKAYRQANIDERARQEQVSKGLDFIETLKEKYEKQDIYPMWVKLMRQEFGDIKKIRDVWISAYRKYKEDNKNLRISR